MLSHAQLAHRSFLLLAFVTLAGRFYRLELIPTGDNKPL